MKKFIVGTHNWAIFDTMGLMTKSFIIVLVAISAPLLYRQFSNDNTVKFMSSYYSNYKSIDQFLRHSASHLDTAKEYLPNSQHIKILTEQFNEKVTSMLVSIKTKSSESIDETIRESQGSKKVTTPSREVQCPHEDLKDEKINLWTKRELANYDGNSGNTDIYLAFLGIVYNVTNNGQHYAGGAEYNSFAGRDATRAFVTGNFTHDLHDDIRDIDNSLYAHIESWSSFYNSSYPILGRLEGIFFDSRGCKTEELARVYEMFDKIESEKSVRQEEESDFPECNSEWNSDTKKGKVWCSTKSGGVERDWVGVPRIYTKGESHRCACFNQDIEYSDEVSKYLSIYPGCEPKATECILTQ